MRRGYGWWLALGVLLVGSGSACDGSRARQDVVIESFSASASRVVRGESVDLTAVFRNGTGTIEPGVGSVESGVPVTLSPVATTEYVLAVRGVNNEFTSVTVEVIDAPAGVVTAPAVIVAGEAAMAERGALDGATYTWLVSSATLLEGQGTARISFRAAAQGTIGLEARATLPGGVQRVSVGSVLIHERPVISLQPLTQQIALGAALTLSVAAAGNGQLSYQWRQDGAALAGQTAATLTRTSTTTDDAGRYDCVITSILGGTTVSVTSAEAQVTALGPPDATQTTVVVNPAVVPADGTSAATVTVSARDAQGQALANLQVSLASNGTNDTFIPASGTTDALGTFVATLTSTKAESKLVTATIATLAKSATAQFVPGAATQVTLTLSPSSLTVGASASLIAVTVRDARGNAVAGEVVTLATSGTQNTLVPVAGVTNAAGLFTASLASTRAETKLVTATAGLTMGVASVLFEAGPATVAQSTLAIAPASAVADGVSTLLVTATLRDTHGNAAAAQAVTLSLGGTNSTFATPNGLTDGAGTFTSALVSTAAGVKVVTATIGAGALSANATFTAGPVSAAQSTVSGAPASVTANGASPSTLTVTARDAQGNPVAGQVVTLSASGTGNALSPVSGTTDATGLFTASLTSTVAEAKTVTASLGSVSVSGSVTFVAGPPSVSTSTFGATPGSVVGNGVATTTLTVTLRDAQGNLAPGQPVTLSSNGSNNTFVPSSGTTTAAGLFTATFATSKVEPKTVTATLGTGTLTTSLSVTWPVCTGQPLLGGRPSLPTGGSPMHIAAADFDADGRIDLATANFNGTVSVFRSTAPGSFATRVDSTVGTGANAIVAADFNQDGRTDLAVTSTTNNAIEVLTNTGNGTFLPSAMLATGNYPLGLVAVDLNGDGRPDLAAANLQSNSLTVFINWGSGFSGPVTHATGAQPNSIAAGDFNGDGRPDLAVGWSLTPAGGVQVFLNQGAGTLGPPSALPASQYVNAVAAADVNQDGRVDLLTGNGSQLSVSVRLNTGAGTFAAATEYATTAAAQSVITVDVNADGRLDLVVPTTTNGFDSSVNLLLNLGSGTFGAAGRHLAGTFPKAVAVADLDGDGAPDLAVANKDSQTVSLLFNLGGGRFSGVPTYATGANPQSVVVADLNADGRLDLAVANTGSNTISVFLNQGGGTLAPQVTYSTGAGPKSLVAADLNGDGRPDLTYVNTGSTTLGLMFNTGAGTFGAAATMAAGALPLAVTAVDLNGDAHVDLLATTYDNTLGVFLNTGAGSFGPRVPYALGVNAFGAAITTGDFNADTRPDVAVQTTVTGPASSYRVGVFLNQGAGILGGQLTTPATATGAIEAGAIAASDLDADGRIDLVSSNWAANTVSVFRNSGAGVFSNPVDYATVGDLASGVCVADFNGDGRPDLVASNLYGSNVNLLLNTGTGTFGAAISYDVSGIPPAVAVGDLNGDGRPDVVTANSGSNTVSVLLYQGCVP